MSWKETLGALAPTLATALGGPFAGAATKFIANKFLGSKDATEVDISDFISLASPEELLEVKNADNEFKLEMEKLGVDVFKIESEDKKNARKEHKLSSMPAIISVALTLFVIGIVYALFYTAPPEAAENVLFMLLGVVIKEWSNSMHYWFGTTRSSNEKTVKLR